LQATVIAPNDMDTVTHSLMDGNDDRKKKQIKLFGELKNPSATAEATWKILFTKCCSTFQRCFIVTSLPIIVASALTT
jgi:hypothetical protein